MTVQTLTPVAQVADGVLDLTANMAAPTQTTLQFANTGREWLCIAPAATSETVTVDIGITVLGQAVTNFTAVNLTNGHVYSTGQFHSLLDIPGGNTVQVVLSTTSNITVGLFQSATVY